MMRKTREEKAITLIALIITIVVLLILAVVAINAVTGDGIIQHATNAKTKYEEAQKQEEMILQDYLYDINEGLGNETVLSIKNSINKVLSNTRNVIVEDVFGNKIVVPAGFKILVDNTTGYTVENINVTKGIVVEDAMYEVTKGSQFVWVPVGKIYTDIQKTKENVEIITLGRYANFTEPYAPVQPDETNSYKTTIEVLGGIEYQPNDETLNAKAKNINGFYESAIKNGGYYIGRYEAGDSTSRESRTGTWGQSTQGTLVCKANQIVYNWILQSDASSKCQSMYTDKNYTSDLINSYAWDTAIVFIQTFGGKADYAASNMGINGFLKTGENGDEYCNINDMSGNASEFTTETYNNTSYPCTIRGGCYYSSNAEGVTSDRTRSSASNSGDIDAFRPVIYID